MSRHSLDIVEQQLSNPDWGLLTCFLPFFLHRFFSPMPLANLLFSGVVSPLKSDPVWSGNLTGTLLPPHTYLVSCHSSVFLSFFLGCPSGMSVWSSRMGSTPLPLSLYPFTLKYSQLKRFDCTGAGVGNADPFPFTCKRRLVLQGTRLIDSSFSPYLAADGVLCIYFLTNSCCCSFPSPIPGHRTKDLC